MLDRYILSVILGFKFDFNFMEKAMTIQYKRIMQAVYMVAEDSKENHDKAQVVAAVGEMLGQAVSTRYDGDNMAMVSMIKRRYASLEKAQKKNPEMARLFKLYRSNILTGINRHLMESGE
jgi:hypothetical protein